MIGLVRRASSEELLHSNYENLVVAGSHAKLYSGGKVERMVFRCGTCTRLLAETDSVYMMMDAAYCSAQCREEADIEVEEPAEKVNASLARSRFCNRSYSCDSLDPRMLESFSWSSSETDAEVHRVVESPLAGRGCRVGAGTGLSDLLTYVGGVIALALAHTFSFAVNSVSEGTAYRFKQAVCTRRQRRSRSPISIIRFRRFAEWTSSICSAHKVQTQGCAPPPSWCSTSVTFNDLPKRSFSYASVRDEEEKPTCPRSMSEGSTVASVTCTFSRNASEE